MRGEFDPWAIPLHTPRGEDQDDRRHGVRGVSAGRDQPAARAHRGLTEEVRRRVDR